jgi:hypothetical protein
MHWAWRLGAKWGHSQSWPSRAKIPLVLAVVAQEGVGVIRYGVGVGVNATATNPSAADADAGGALSSVRGMSGAAPESVGPSAPGRVESDHAQRGHQPTSAGWRYGSHSARLPCTRSAD